MTLDFTEGMVLPIYKPYGMTSFGALARVRGTISRHLGVRRIKIGHAGTLDPLATGVLLLCIGRATKQIEQLQQKTKEYIATIKLGATTPSYDREHPVDATFPTQHITRQTIEDILNTQFTGTIQQVPPTYSACKIEGKRAYDLMRKGKEVQLKPKPVVIHEIDIQQFSTENMTLTMRVVCSKGTYIRALARDLGEALHSGAYLYDLQRTRIGQYTLQQCKHIEDIPDWLNQHPLSFDTSQPSFSSGGDTAATATNTPNS